MVLPRQAPASWRIARRELRGGVRGFRVFLACLILGVGITAAVGSLGEALKAGLARDARMILGGDVELVQFSQPLAQEAMAYLEANTAALSHVVTMRGMARDEDGAHRSLVELKAVDGAYPLVDRARLEDGTALADALASGGAAVEKGLLDRLGIGIGDRVRIGAALLTVRGVLVREPDRLTGGIALGPRLMLDHASLQETELVQPGTLVRHRYRALVPEGAVVAGWVAGLETAFPDAVWRLRDTRDANPSLRRQLDRVGLFLTLAGLAALLVGGIGVASAVSSHLHGKLHTIAALKCVGATQATVQRAFLLQLGVLGLGAIAAGLILGAAAPPVLSALFGDTLPVPLAGVIHGAPLALAAAYGALTMLAFSLWPLGRAARTRPGVLFRGAAAPASGWPPLVAIAGTALAALALAGIAVGTAPRMSIALGFVLGAPVALAIFRAAAALVVILARRTRPRRLPALRLGFANLARPGRPRSPSRCLWAPASRSWSRLRWSRQSRRDAQRPAQRRAAGVLLPRYPEAADRPVRAADRRDGGRRLWPPGADAARPRRPHRRRPGARRQGRAGLGMGHPERHRPQLRRRCAAQCGDRRGRMVARRLRRATAGLAGGRGGARFRAGVGRHPLDQRARA